MPHVLTTNLTWSGPLLVSLPEKYFQPGVSIHGTALAVEFDPEIMIDTNYFKDGLRVKLFYEVSGTLVEDESLKRVMGTLSVNQYYVKDFGLLEQEILFQIQSVAAGGNTEAKKELLIMKRDAGKMQPVPEQLIKTE